MDDKLNFLYTILEENPALARGNGPDLDTMIGLLHYMIVLFGPQLFSKLADEFVSTPPPLCYTI